MFKKIANALKKNIVFVVTIAISFAVILYGSLNSSGINALSLILMDGVNKYFSWLYLFIMFAAFVFLIWLVCSKYGNIKLGKDDDRPEHSRLSWFAMLFCGGTGIGLVFWSIAEPLTHFGNPYGDIVAGSEEAANFSIRTCFLHWGFIPWACFAVVGLGLAYFHFRKGKKALISSTLSPLIGDKLANGFIGKIIDMLSVLVTVAGVATSLGLGCLQICGGGEYLFDIPNNETTWLIVILVIAVIFLVSSITGVNKGIKWLSNLNSVLAIVLLIAGFVLGPTSDILNTFVNGLGQHISNFIGDSLSIVPSGDDWVINWRVFYWAWWIAWSPFVGMFIARISKGRTIKEFIVAVLIVPALLTFFWYSVFGCIALTVAKNWSIEAIVEIASHPETAVFVVFEQIEGGGMFLSILTIIVLIIFFITSADSATLSLSMFSSDGNHNPPVWKKIVWGIIEAATAYVLLLSGGLKALQTISIVAALPFLFMLVLIGCGLVKSFIEEKKGKKGKIKPLPICIYKGK